MGVGISITVLVGRRVELPRSLFGYAGRREEDFVASLKFSSSRRGRYCCLVHRLPLRQVRAVLRADDFGDALAQHSKRGDQHPEPPDTACRREEEASEGDQQKPDSAEYLGYSICYGGRAFVFGATVAVSPSA